MTQTYPVNEYQVQIASGRTGTIRKAVEEDLPRIAAIHQKAFSNFFLTRLGGEFLRRYYRLVLRYRAGIVLVSESCGALEGFACGFIDPAEFYRLMSCNSRLFVLPAMRALVRQPSLATRVLRAVQRIQRPASGELAPSCELSSVAVAPEAGGRGLGKALVEAFLERAWSMGARRVCLTTDADANEPANALYRKTGFQHTRRFLRYHGRWMNEYVMQRSEAAGSRGMRP